VALTRNPDPTPNPTPDPAPDPTSGPTPGPTPDPTPESRATSERSTTPQSGTTSESGTTPEGRPTSVRDSTIRAAADALAALAAHAAAAPAAAVQLATDDEIVILGACGLPPEIERLPASQALAGLVAAGGFPVVVEDTHGDTRIDPRALVHILQLRAYIGFPVRDRQGRVAGVVCVLDRRPRRWTAAELTAVDRAALACTALISDQVARAREEAFRACERAVVRELGEAETVEEAGPGVLRALVSTLGWVHGELWLVHEPAQLLLPAATWTDRKRKNPPPVPDQLAYGSGLAGRTWQDGKPLWIREMRALGVPVLSGPNVVGVLTLFADGVDEHDDALVALLSGVAAHVGQFLDRRRAEELRVELTRSKDEYLALLGHELRTPLTSVATYAELLRDADPSTVATLAEVINRNAAVLRQIVDDLLDLAALDTGHAVIRAQRCDLVVVLSEALDAAGGALAAAGLELTVDLPDQLVVPGDIKRLRQVMDNLLGNAIKFSPDGGRVTVSARRVDPHTAEVTVSDTGIGVPAAERDRLFDRFYRSSRTRDRAIPGTGLSLAISRAIVERHQGTISLVSGDRPGTTIRVRLQIR
jgi:signal transduction histidine kinase